MKCNKMDGLLSAFANGELTEEQLSTIDSHLAGCAECREKLEGYIRVRRKMETLRDMPPAPDSKADIMSRIISDSGNERSFSGWKKRLMIIVPVMLVLLAVLTIQPWNSPLSPQSVLAQAYARMAEITSYRSVITSISTENRSSSFEIEYTSPGLYHLKQASDEDSREFILIGDEQYYRCTGIFEQGIFASFISMQSLTNSFSNMITLEATSKWLNMLTDVRELPEEEIEGVTCLHYSGVYNFEKMLRTQQETNAERGIPPLSNEEFEEELAEYRATVGERILELWIGKDDYLLRQIKTTFQRQGASQPNISIQKFYDFNQPISIEAPVDTEGRPLPGWLTTTPEEPAFSKEIRQVNIDNDNPENRQINYTIVLSNISEETLSGFSTMIMPGITDAMVGVKTSLTTLTKDLVSTEGAGPASFTLQPGAAQQYDVNFSYDATSTGPEKIVEAIENAVFYLGYVTPDGQQKIEVVHFEVPDAVYTLPTATLPSFDLKPAGEYRVDEPGASSSGHGVIGEINGSKYLFVQVGTQNSETAMPPGILVLNIDNPAAPVKVSYLPATEGTTYMMNSALSGTVLYVSTGDYLWIIDVSNPDSLKELARFSGVHATTLVAAGKYLYVNDSNIKISALDVTDPSQPRVLGSIDMPSRTGTNLQISGGFLLARQGDTLHTIDISSPNSLKIVNEYVFTYPDGHEAHVRGQTVYGNYSYAMLSGDAGTGISIIDISDISVPEEVAYLDLKDKFVLSSLFSTGERIYLITSGESILNDKEKLEIIDISNPSRPEELGTAIMPYYWSFFDNNFSSSSYSSQLVDKYLYWYIGNPPNIPVIEIFDLSEIE